MTCGYLVLTDKCVSDLSLQYEYVTEDTGQKSAQSRMMVTLMVWDLEAPKSQGYNNLTWGRKSCLGWRPKGQLTRNTACMYATGFLFCSMASCSAACPPQKTNLTASLQTLRLTEWWLPSLLDPPCYTMLGVRHRLIACLLLKLAYIKRKAILTYLTVRVFIPS